MSDLITPSKGLTQPAAGGDNDTWGALLNTDLTLIDKALGGTLFLSISGSITLTSTQTRNTGYKFTGTLTGTATITWPSFSGMAVIQNVTSGGFSVICGVSGATVAVLNGETVAIWGDGTNFVRLAQIGGGPQLSPNPNILINDNFRYDQPNEGAPYGVNGLQVAVMDGWVCHCIGGTGSTNNITVQQVSTSPTPPPGAAFCAKVTVVTSPGTSDHFTFEHRIEADRLTNLGWGTSSPQPITISFYQYPSISGTYSLALINDKDANRSYVHQYSLVANRWNYVEFTVPGDSGDVWNTSGTADQGMEMDFILGAAGHFQTGTINAWQNGEFLAGEGQVDMMTVTGAFSAFSRIKMEIGSVATPQRDRQPAEEFEIIQRYYEKSYGIGIVPGTPAADLNEALITYTTETPGAGYTVRYAQPKLTNVAPIIYSAMTGTVGKAWDYVNSADVDLTIGVHSTKGFAWYGAPASGSQVYLAFQWVCDTRLM